MKNAMTMSCLRAEYRGQRELRVRVYFIRNSIALWYVWNLVEVLTCRLLVARFMASLMMAHYIVQINKGGPIPWPSDPVRTSHSLCPDSGRPCRDPSPLSATA